jgi:hypothetical protein
MEFDRLNNTFIDSDGVIGFADPTFWMNAMFVQQSHAPAIASMRATIIAQKQADVKIRKKWTRMASEESARPTMTRESATTVGSGRKFTIPTMIVPRNTGTMSRGLLGASRAKVPRKK